MEGIAPIESQDGTMKLPYVGYYYDAKDGAVFILPKVFMVNIKVEDNGDSESQNAVFKAFGRYKPEILSMSRLTTLGFLPRIKLSFLEYRHGFIRL